MIPIFEELAPHCYARDILHLMLRFVTPEQAARSTGNRVSVVPPALLYARTLSVCHSDLILDVEPRPVLLLARRVHVEQRRRVALYLLGGLRVRLVGVVEGHFQFVDVRLDLLLYSAVKREGEYLGSAGPAWLGLLGWRSGWQFNRLFIGWP